MNLRLQEKSDLTGKKEPKQAEKCQKKNIYIYQNPIFHYMSNLTTPYNV